MDLSIMDISLMERNMAMALFCIIAEINMKENFAMIKWMEKVNILILMGELKKVHGERDI
jgi:hypothetical protein